MRAVSEDVEAQTPIGLVRVPLILLLPLMLTMSLYVIVYYGANSSYALDATLKLLNEDLIAGELYVAELVLSPTFREVTLLGATIDAPDGARVADVRDVHVTLEPLALGQGKLIITAGELSGVDLKLRFDEDGHVTIQMAFSAPPRDAPKDPKDVGGGLALHLAGISITDARVDYDSEVLAFVMEDVEVSQGAVRFEPRERFEDEDELDIDIGDYTSRVVHMSFPPEVVAQDLRREDWTFDIHEFHVERWRWRSHGIDVEGLSGQGFTVGRVRGDLDGYFVDARGVMGFPRLEDGAVQMTYDAEGDIRVSYSSSFLEYYVDEDVRWEIPSVSIEVEGDLDHIDGRGDIHIQHAVLADVQLDDVRLPFVMENRWIRSGEGTAKFYGGEIVVMDAFYDIVEAAYGAKIDARRFDPMPLLDDIGFPGMTYFSGEVSAVMALAGEIPASTEFEPGKPMNLYDSATDRYADLELLSDLVFERDNAELIPYRRVTVEEGSTLWVTLEKVGVPEAVVRTPEDTFTISEFVMDWVEGDLPLSPWLDARGARLQAEFADIGPWLREYDITGLSSGTSRFDIWAKGNLLTPDLWITAKMDRPAIVSQAPDASGRFRERFPAESMKTSMVLEEGTITFETLDIDLGDGHIRFARGDTMSALSAEPYEGDEDLITWWPKEVIPSKLSVEVDDVGLGRLEQNILREMGLMGTHASLQELLDKRGVRAFDGRLDGDILLFDDLYAPLLCVELEVTGGQIYVEPVPRAALSATVRSPGARSRCPGDDGTQPLAASRGTDTILHALRVEVPGASEPITMSGRVDGEGALGVTVDASRVKLSEVRTLQALMGAEPGTPGVRGELSAHLDVGGTTASPSLGGSARVLAMKVGTYALGDLALVMDTATREILTFDGPEQLSTIRVAGSLLPWLTLDVEVPLSDEEPRTAAIGFEGLDVLELARRTGLSEQIPGFALLARLQRATGSGEIILSSQGDRLDVRAEIPEARVHMPGLTLTNDEPLKLSYSSSVVDGEAVELVGVDHLSVGSGGDFVSVTGGGTLDAGVFYVDVAGAIDLEWIEPLREALPTLMPELVREATGKLALAGSVTTTASTGSVPQVDASMSFENASFVLVGYEEPLEVERGEVVVRNDRVLLGGDDVLRGTFLGGSFFASGALGLEQFAPKTMDLRLRTFNINYRVPDVASVTLDTDLRMTASDLDSFGTWGVSGSVDILDGLYTQNISVIEQQLTGRVLGAFDRSTELFEASTFEDYPELEDLTLDLDVRARDSFRIKNQIDRFGLDLELRMDLAISGTFGDPGVFGSVEVVDGLVGFQGEEFTMENGEIGFTGDLSNPRIDVVAGADIRNACATDVTQESTLTVVDLGSTGREDEEELYHVTLNVRGTPDKLDILYESDPFADQRDVLSLIFTGCTVDLLTASSASQPTLEIALGPLIGRLEREIQDVIKVEEFTIVPGVERAQVRISDSLTRRVSWKFELNTGFADRSDTQLGLLEFKFTDRWALQVSEQVLTGGTNATNQFNLNLNLNYRLPLD